MDNEVKKKLDERLVNGEITPEEYEKILNTIESTHALSSENNVNRDGDVGIDKESIYSEQNSTAKQNIHEINVEKGFFKKLRDGDYGLAQTYWFYGIVVNVFVGLIIRLIIMGMRKDGILLAFGIVILDVIYTAFFQAPGLWRAAKRYKGTKIWAVLGQIVAVIAVIASAFVLIQWFKILEMAGIL